LFLLRTTTFYRKETFLRQPAFNVYQSNLLTHRCAHGYGLLGAPATITVSPFAFTTGYASMPLTAAAQTLESRTQLNNDSCAEAKPEKLQLDKLVDRPR